MAGMLATPASRVAGDGEKLPKRLLAVNTETVIFDSAAQQADERQQKSPR
jgi:hypothetical protein